MTSPGLSEMFAYHAVTMANTIKTSLIVFSRKVRPQPPAALASPGASSQGALASRSKKLSPHAHAAWRPLVRAQDKTGPLSEVSCDPTVSHYMQFPLTACWRLTLLTLAGLALLVHSFDHLSAC